MRRRIAIVSNVMPLVEPLAARLRELGHEPVAWLLGRRAGESRPPPPWGEVTDSSGPRGLSILLAQDRDAVAGLLRGLDLDVRLCWGFSWKLPQEALDVPRLGSVNQHPGRLPRHRGPYPMTWAVRDGDDVFGLTWHRMDADYDTGPILAETTVPIEDGDTTIEQIGQKMLPAALDLLPSLTDPGDGARAVECADGRLWIVEYEPAAT
jgi:methionyl-tRNA formyltransferase